MGFTKAVRERAKLRLMLDGPAKAGKTTTALRLAVLLGSTPAVIDAEQGKAALCAGENWDGVPCEFAHAVLTTYSPMEYTAKIQEAAASGYNALVIDGLSPAWDGIGGALEMHDTADEKNSFFAWKPVTRVHRRMLDAILNYPGHVICTMRSKMAYVSEKNAKGQEVPRRIGLAPVQRAGIEYEFDLLASMDADHVCRITGARCQALDGLEGHKPGREFWQPLLEWLATGQVVAAGVARIAMATDVQVASIRQLWIDLSKTQRIAKAGLFRKYSVNELHQLTEEQAKQVLGELRAEAILEGKTSPAAGQQTSQHGADIVEKKPLPGEGQTLQGALAADKETSDAAQATATAGDKNAALQRLSLARDSYFCSVGLTDAETVAVKDARRKLWGEIMSKQGVASATLLTPLKVNEIADKLEKRVMELTEKRRKGGETCTTGGTPSATSPAENFQS